MDTNQNQQADQTTDAPNQSQAPASEPTAEPTQPQASVPEPVTEPAQAPTAAPEPAQDATSAPAPDPPAKPAQPTAPPPDPESAPEAAPSQNSDQPKRVLLVEDDFALANVYLTRLVAEGFDVRRVANGEDALATALSFQPDLILLDVMMPKVSGFDVLDILRNTPETAKIKIIMLTALSQDSDMERAKSLGVDEYLVKSQVVIADVVQKIKAHLGES